MEALAGWPRAARGSAALRPGSTCRVWAGLAASGVPDDIFGAVSRPGAGVGRCGRSVPAPPWQRWERCWSGAGRLQRGAGYESHERAMANWAQTEMSAGP